MLPMEIRIVHDFTSLESVLVNVLTRLAAMPAPEMMQPAAVAAPAVAVAPDDQKQQPRRGRRTNEEKAAAAATNVTADAAPAVPPVPAAPAQVSPSPAPAAPAVTAFDPFDAPAPAPVAAADPNGPVSEEDLAAMRNIIMDQFIPKLGQAAYDEIRVKHGGPGVRITTLKRGQFDAFRNELLAKLNG